MHKIFRIRFGFSCSNNRKSKSGPADQNRKWLGLFAIGVTFSLCGAVAEAQQAKRGHLIGVLRHDRPGDTSGLSDVTHHRLRELGWIEGKNLAFEYRWAEGKAERLPKLAAELVAAKVDLIVASAAQAALAAKNVTKTIPILMVGIGLDPVEAGLVESLARPGGNITGLTVFGVETAGKRLELFKEAIPKIKRVAILYDPANPGNLLEVKEVFPIAARPLKLTIQPREVSGTEDFDRVFAALSKARPDGLFVAGGPLMNANEKRIVSFALKSWLPSTYNRTEAVEAGGLMSYTIDRVDHYRRAAEYVDKILKGTKPADLPVERPMKFEFAVNLKTAKQIGVTIPQSVLFRADRAIR
jgi:putative ABC transport system substrate-binding protein